jgi:hypothetical protein
MGRAKEKEEIDITNSHQSIEAYFRVLAVGENSSNSRSEPSWMDFEGARPAAPE